MFEQDSRTRITNLIQRRDKLQANVQRLQGRLDSARAERDAAEAECRKRKIDPEKIDDIIDQLSAKIGAEIEALEAQMRAAEDKVAPFLREE